MGTMAEPTSAALLCTIVISLKRSARWRTTWAGTAIPWHSRIGTQARRTHESSPRARTWPRASPTKKSTRASRAVTTHATFVPARSTPGRSPACMVAWMTAKGPMPRRMVPTAVAAAITPNALGSTRRDSTTTARPVEPNMTTVPIEDHPSAKSVWRLFSREVALGGGSPAGSRSSTVIDRLAGCPRRERTGSPDRHQGERRVVDLADPGPGRRDGSGDGGCRGSRSACS